MEKSLNNLSIKRFSEYMIAQQSEFDIPLDKTIAALSALLNVDIEELNNKDVFVIRNYITELNTIGNTIFDELLVQEPIKEFVFEDVKYFVAFTDDNQLFIKKKELDFISKVLKTDSDDELLNAKQMLLNLHLVAAIIFRKETETWKEDRFNEDSTRALADIFQIQMKAKHIFPYLPLIKNKLLPA